MMNLKVVSLIVSLSILPSKSPREAGMSMDKLDRIEYVARKGINLGAYPGTSIIIGKDSSIVYERGIGKQSWGGNNVIPSETMYDLASLTKVISTTSAVMFLYDRKKIDLDAPVLRYLPKFHGGEKDEVTIGELLTHTAGLPAGLTKISYSRNEVNDDIINKKLICKPGKCYLYSDLGPVILGMIVERISGIPLNRLVRDSIFKPIGMNSTLYLPHDSMSYRIAATDVPAGQVSDELARRLGGVSGNAGLFSTAYDLAIFSQMMLNYGELNGTRIFKDSTVRLFTTNIREDRAFGWQTCKGRYGCGSLSTRAFGHTGYTGTSIWIDPEQDLFVVILTNRLNKPKTSSAQRVTIAVRNDIANIALSAVDEIHYIVKRLSINSMINKINIPKKKKIAKKRRKR